jgi:hypothetical protein
MDDFVDERITVQEFCSAYERMWNFDDDRAALSATDLAVFEKLLDVTVWYTPVAEDRRTVPRYKDEAEVLNAVHAARLALSEG